ncbi:uncharacterized protein DS421_11g325690 [Arachis hypogaea]|nr:uncharacterized protein DS421_11g325690 [Arachis hypogaea]
MTAIYLLLEILGPSKLFAASHFLSRGCLPYYIRSTLQLLEKRTKKKIVTTAVTFDYMNMKMHIIHNNYMNMKMQCLKRKQHK